MKTLKNIHLAVIATIISLYANVYAATIEVGSGKPFTTIQSAINAASVGDTILVYDGIYNETIIVSKKLIVKSVNGSGSTIIDATGRSNGFTSTVRFVSGLGLDTVLDGFTIAHGYSFEGGNIICYDSSPTISNCFIYGGRSVYGAGIYCYGGPLITNCVISGNACAYGGGFYGGGFGNAPTIMNCTISLNRTDNGGSITDARGAGIFCNSFSAIVVNTIIWGNTANGLPNTISGGSVSISYSDLEGGWTGTGNIGSDPQFAMPGYWNNNGTASIGDDYWIPGDFHLQAISPCVDSGTSSDAPSFDIEGTPRPQGAGFDMGAYELVTETTSTTTSIVPTTTTTVPPPDQCSNQYTSGEPYIVYTGSNLNCPFVDWGLVNYFQHIVPFPADIQNIEYYATVNLNGATGCVDLRVVIENNYGAAQYFNNVINGQQIIINVPRSYFENTNFDECSSNWFVHTADLGWQFQQCGGGWLGSSIISSPKPGCNLNLNTCCPEANCCVPTAITLSSFTEEPDNRSVMLTWTTETETNNAGFNLYRSESEDGAYIKLNDSLIPSKGSSTQGASYEFIDTNVQNRKTYYYKLEDIDTNGNSTFHGTVKAVPRWWYGMGK